MFNKTCHALVAAAALLACTAAAQAQDAAPAPAVAPAPATASAPATRCIAVDVHNVRPQQGQLFLAAFGSAETYNRKPMAAVRVPAGEATTRLELCGISGSELAITLYQDLDGDGKMGKNLMGMPTEPWGSTGKPGLFGPSWETGRVVLDGTPVIARLAQ